MHDAAQRIERLREFRSTASRERDLSINAMVKAAAAQAERTNKRLGQLIDLWEELLPPELAARTAIMSMRGGTAHVTVDSSATAFEIDRRLREGLLRELVSRYPGTLLRVKVKQGAAEERDGDGRAEPTKSPRGHRGRRGKQ